MFGPLNNSLYNVEPKTIALIILIQDVLIAGAESVKSLHLQCQIMHHLHIRNFGVYVMDYWD